MGLSQNWKSKFSRISILAHICGRVDTHGYDQTHRTFQFSPTYVGVSDRRQSRSWKCISILAHICGRVYLGKSYYDDEFQFSPTYVGVSVNINKYAYANLCTMYNHQKQNSTKLRNLCIFTIYLSIFYIQKCGNLSENIIFTETKNVGFHILF